MNANYFQVVSSNPEDVPESSFQTSRCGNLHCEQAFANHKQEIDRLNSLILKLLSQNEELFFPSLLQNNFNLDAINLNTQPPISLVSLETRLSSDKSLNPTVATGWPDIKTMKSFLNNQNLKKYYGDQPKVQLLKEINDYLKSLLDDDSSSFLMWLELYSSAKVLKMTTLANSIIEHILQWPHIFGDNFKKIPSTILLDNLKRALLKIFHKVKRTAVIIKFKGMDPKTDPKEAVVQIDTVEDLA